MKVTIAPGCALHVDDDAKTIPHTSWLTLSEHLVRDVNATRGGGRVRLLGADECYNPDATVTDQVVRGFRATNDFEREVKTAIETLVHQLRAASYIEPSAMALQFGYCDEKNSSINPWRDFFFLKARLLRAQS